MPERIKAQHGTVCRLPGQHFSYFAWPSVARLDNGRLVVGSSGLRTEHACPFGKTVLHFSADEGETWSAPRVINDSPLDDRDDGPDWDLGYPASVEMPDGSIFTVYYQKAAAHERCSVLWTRWNLPSG